MARKPITPMIYEAIDDALINGTTYVMRGNTVVAGHPLLKGRMKLFRPFVPTFGEMAEPEPEPEPKSEAEGEGK